MYLSAKAKQCLKFAKKSKYQKQTYYRWRQKYGGTIIRGGVAQGEPGKSGVSTEEMWGNWNKANLDGLLEPGQSRTDFMLRFTISHPDMHTTIVGTLNPEHLEENLRGIKAGSLPADTYAEAKRHLDEVGICTS